MPAPTQEPPAPAKDPQILISSYPKEERHVGRSVVTAVTIHILLAALVCLITYLLGITTLKELLSKGGSIATNGPAPEEPMTVELQLEDITPPPTPNPEFILDKPKPPPPTPPPPKKPDKPVDKPKPRYTAPNAHGSGKSETVSNFVVGSSGLPGPGYPYAARAAHEEGTVRVHVLFDAGGKASDVSIIGSSGVPVLDVVTRNFILANWHNASLANQAVEVPVVFSLNSATAH